MPSFEPEDESYCSSRKLFRVDLTALRVRVVAVCYVNNAGTSNSSG